MPAGRTTTADASLPGPARHYTGLALMGLVARPALLAAFGVLALPLGLPALVASSRRYASG